MTLTGWILDVQPHRDRLELVLLDKDGRLKSFSYKTFFRGYILPINHDPEEITRDLESSPRIVRVWIENWFVPPRYRRVREVVVYETKSLDDLYIIQSITRRKRIGLNANNYPHPLIQTLWRNNIPTTTLIKITNNKVEVLEDPGRVDYRNPPIKKVIVKLLHGKHELLTPREEPTHILIETNNGVETHPYPEAITILHSLRGHIGFISSIDRLVLENLHHGLLGSIAPVWLNTDTLLVGLNGLIEWSRLSYTPIRMLNGASIGNVLTIIEALKALEKKYLVVKGYGRVEKPRSIRDLILHDRGGTIYTPRPGTYWRICQIDYSSLYPSIIMKYNVSGETVDDPNCTIYIDPPGSSHRVCIDREGVVAATMKTLVPRKESYRELLRNTLDSRFKTIIEERMKAVKWILVASFGYLGYRNSLFGSIMAHEVVTSVDRYITYKARLKLRSLGIKTIHVLVDSLFVEKNGFSCREINEIIMGETGFKSRVEAEYTWLTIPVSSRGMGYSNRYFGRLTSGGLKIKGLYAVRRDTPGIIRRAQLEALEILGEAESREELFRARRKARRVFEKYDELIMNGRVELEDLAFTRRIHTPPERGFIREITSRMKTTPLRVYYVVAPGRVYVSLDEAPGKYDRGYYHELLIKAFKEINVL